MKAISAKAKRLSKNRENRAFENLEDAFSAIDIQIPEFASKKQLIRFKNHQWIFLLICNKN